MPVYPFAAELFKTNGIPKRIIPSVVALGAFSFTMDALPGTPQIQNIIPTGTFDTTSWAAPTLGIIGSIFIFVVGLIYLNWRVRSMTASSESYSSGMPLINEPEAVNQTSLPNLFLALSALVLIGLTNFFLTYLIKQIYTGSNGKIMPHLLKKSTLPGLHSNIEIVAPVAIWAVKGALLVGIIFITITAWKTIKSKITEGSKAAVLRVLTQPQNMGSVRLLLRFQALLL